MKFKALLLSIAMLGFSLISTSISNAVVGKTISFQAEGWADNWFALYINGKKVGEDSVPITTIKSFNSTIIKFSATYPFTVGVMAKDYTENSSGLEYIGKPNQQIGDGGFALQIREVSSGKIVAYTNKSWKSFIVNKAPTNPECVSSINPLQDCKYSNTKIPSLWSASSFKDTSWLAASEFSAEAVGVKEGYFDINWSKNTKLIWSGDLKLDNVILFRTIVKDGNSASQSNNQLEKGRALTVTSTSVSQAGEFNKDITCDGAGQSPQISWTSGPQATQSYVVTMDTIPGPPRPGEAVGADHSYFNLFNIPSAVHSINQNDFSAGQVGMNFKNNHPGYEAPCSQGPGPKTYTISVFALSKKLTLNPTSASQSALFKAMQGLILAQGQLAATYTRA